MSGNPLYVGPFLHLRTLPAFEELTHVQLRELAYAAQETLLPRGTSLISQGEAGAAMYLIVDGFVDTGQRTMVGPGGVVGFLDVLASGPAARDAVADTDVLALRLETDDLRDVCEQNFAILTALLTYVAGRVTDDWDALMKSIVGRRAQEVSQPHAPARVGRILALHRTLAFRSKNMDALAELAGHLEQREVEAHETLWRTGEEASGFYVIASGGVRFGGGAVRETAELGPGAVPGLVETLAGRDYRCEAVTTRPGILLRVGVEPFLDVIEDHFEMAFGLVGWLARNLIESTTHEPASGRAG
jgi:CRP-like cAMP-binding protein